MERLEHIRRHLSFNQTRINFNDIFGHLTLAPLDPILGTTIKWRADKSELKMNLGVGAYRSDEEKPVVFEIVKHVEKELLEELNTNKVNKEYFFSLIKGT